MTDELVAAFGRLIPQLSSSSPPRTAPTGGDRRRPDSALFVARVDGPDRRQPHAGAVPHPDRASRRGSRTSSSTSAAGAGGRRGAQPAPPLEEARRRGAKDVSLTSRPSREAANRLYQRHRLRTRETNVYRYSGRARPEPAHLGRGRAEVLGGLADLPVAVGGGPARAASTSLGVAGWSGPTNGARASTARRRIAGLSVTAARMASSPRRRRSRRARRPPPPDERIAGAVPASSISRRGRRRRRLVLAARPGRDLDDRRVVGEERQQVDVGMAGGDRRGPPPHAGSGRRTAPVRSPSSSARAARGRRARSPARRVVVGEPAAPSRRRRCARRRRRAGRAVAVTA